MKPRISQLGIGTKIRTLDGDVEVVHLTVDFPSCVLEVRDGRGHYKIVYSDDLRVLKNGTIKLSVKD